MTQNTSTERLSTSAWFPHDTDCTADPKLAHLISKFKALGYAVYFRVIELMHDSADGRINVSQDEVTLLNLADQMGVSPEEITSVIDYAVSPCRLFYYAEDGESLCSKRVTHNLNHRKNIADARREAVKKRWEKSVQKKNNSNTNVVQPNTGVIQNHTDKSRVDKSIYLSTLLLTTSTDIITCLGGPATSERLFGAFCSAYPRAFTDEAKKWLSEFWKGLSEEKAREVTENLAIDLDTKGADWKDFDNLTAYVDY